MSSHIGEVPLTRRLVDHFLMFGLACVLVCIVLSLFLGWNGLLTAQAPMTAIAPLLLLLVGGAMLRRTVRLNSEIENQLRRMAMISSSAEFPLQPLADNEPTAIGWNAILERVATADSLAAVEARLSRSLEGLDQHRLERLIQSLPDGLALTDAADGITHSNRSLDALLDVEGSIAGQSMRDRLVHWAGHEEIPDDKLAEPLRTTVFELCRGTSVAAGVLRVARYPLTGSQAGNDVHVWLLRDVTQQRLAEEARNQFVFTATHELRTPLANIKAYAETLVLHEGIDIEQQKTFCNTINAEATRLSRFVDEMLNINQMEAGALSLARHETDIERLLQEAFEHVQPQMHQKNLEFQQAIPPKLSKLFVDKDKVSAALVNLLGNAAKYTPDGGRVRLEVVEEPGEMLFHVEDSGIGIAAEELSQVFNKFFRSSDDRVRDVSGNGLGLSFTQEVVRLHGGQLTVHSELDKGSRFTMVLPKKQG